MPDRPAIALDIGVLLGLAGPDVGQGDALHFSPGHQRGTDVFRAIVESDRRGLSAPFDDLGSGLVLDHSQNRTVAARAIADR